MVCAPGGVPAGIVTVAVNAPVASVAKVPRCTGVECSVTSTSVFGMNPSPCTVIWLPASVASGASPPGPLGAVVVVVVDGSNAGGTTVVVLAGSVVVVDSVVVVVVVAGSVVVVV